MDGTTNHLRVVLKKYQSSTAKRRTTFLNGYPNLVPVSASRTQSYLTYCRGKSDRWRPATFRPPLVRRGMPPTKHTIIFDWWPSRLCRTEIRGHHTRRLSRAWTAGSETRAVATHEGSTDRQYDDILLQALPHEYKATLRAYLGREEPSDVPTSGL